MRSEILVKIAFLHRFDFNHESLSRSFEAGSRIYHWNIFAGTTLAAHTWSSAVILLRRNIFVIVLAIVYHPLIRTLRFFFIR